MGRARTRADAAASPADEETANMVPTGGRCRPRWCQVPAHICQPDACVMTHPPRGRSHLERVLLRPLRRTHLARVCRRLPPARARPCRARWDPAVNIARSRSRRAVRAPSPLRNLGGGERRADFSKCTPRDGATMDWSDDDDDAEGCAPPRTMKPRGPAPGRSTPSSATTRSSASSTRGAGTSCGSSPPPPRTSRDSTRCFARFHSTPTWTSGSRS